MPHSLSKNYSGSQTNLKAFTLIELLVVIAIIGILSSVVLASLATARNKALDAERLSDMRQIQKAVELYAADNNGLYPVLGWTGACSGWSTNYGTLTTALSKYLPSMPTDPEMVAASSQNCYLYASYDAGKSYKILDYSMQKTTPSSHPAFVDPRRNGATSCGGVAVGTVDASKTWAIWNSDAAMCW